MNRSDYTDLISSSFVLYVIFPAQKDEERSIES